MKTATLATRRWWYIMPIVFITYSPVSYTHLTLPTSDLV